MRSKLSYEKIDEDQKNKAIASKENVAAKLYDDPIVTEITPASTFYKAEVYHQDYFNSHRSAPYCMVVINPKVAKLKQKFSHKLKEANV